jgi:hypothetical protein
MRDKLRKAELLNVSCEISALRLANNCERDVVVRLQAESAGDSGDA